MSPDARSVTAKAPGKINVFLRVGALQDDGYHDLATAYQAVSLCEEVRATRADDFSVTFEGPIDTSHLEVDESNIAIKAARLLARTTDYRGGVRLDITKRVPIAGGMGGGSADAAATLVACDALWGTGLSREDLHGLAAQLGADVPFALMGGTAIGTGRGDELSPALAKGSFDWVLVLADHGLSTPVVFRELDRHRERNSVELAREAGTAPVVDSNVLQALRAGDAHLLAETMHNDLQAPALHLAPNLAAVLELGERNGALAGIVSGSGPTIAFLTADRNSAISLQIALSAARLDVVRVTAPAHGARILHD